MANLIRLLRSAIRAAIVFYEFEEQKRKAEAQAEEDSKADVGWESQIRSYVLDQSRVKDLRTSVESGDPDSVLNGGLNKFIEASLKQGV